MINIHALCGNVSNTSLHILLITEHCKITISSNNAPSFPSKPVLTQLFASATVSSTCQAQILQQVPSSRWLSISTDHTMQWLHDPLTEIRAMSTLPLPLRCWVSSLPDRGLKYYVQALGVFLLCLWRYFPPTLAGRLVLLCSTAQHPGWQSEPWLWKFFT